MLRVFYLTTCNSFTGCILTVIPFAQVNLNIDILVLICIGIGTGISLIYSPIN